MEIQRAQEITKSPDTIRVTHNDVPIYIQNVNENTGIARIYPLNDPEYEQDVPVSTLIEH